MGFLIGISGKKGSGKDTSVGKLLIERGFVQLSFADPLREIAKVLFLLDDRHCFDRELKEQPGPMGISYRRGMQAVGDLIRGPIKELLPELDQNLPEGCSVGESLTIRLMRLRCARLLSDNCNIVITDVRFPDEAKLVEELNGSLVHVRRPGLDSDDGHVSETMVDAVAAMVDKKGAGRHIVLLNDGTREQLQNNLLKFADSLT